MSLSQDMSMREMRMAISRLSSLVSQLQRVGDENTKKIAELATLYTSVAQTALRAQFYGAQFASMIKEGKYLGAASLLIGPISQGMAQGFEAAAYTISTQQGVEKGYVKFGTEADREAFWAEHRGGIVLSFFGLRTW